VISIKKGEQFTIGDDSSLLVSSCGTAKIENIEYKDVIHVPGLGPNLLSITALLTLIKRWNFGQTDGLLKT